jgi:regulatory protein
MKITRIESQRNIDRVNIYIDNKFAFGLTDEIRYKYDLQTNKEIDEKFIEDVLKAEEQRKIINKALNLISYRQRSIQEVRNNLKEKGYEEIYIEKAIEYCKGQNYLNDEEFALSFIRDKQNLNNLGSKRIKYELINKGVSETIIEKILQIDPEDEYSIALELAEKRIKSYNGQDRNSIYRKLGGFLQRKGYPFDIVKSVLDEVLRNN